MFIDFFDGVSASSLWEAQLAHDGLKPVHTYSPAYKRNDINQS